MERGKTFIAEARAKMDKLAEDFADGKINREQFQALYERYQTQINGVKALLAEADPTKWLESADSESTIDIRSRLMGKGVGMLIYTNKSGMLLDKLGDTLIDPLLISELMEKLSKQAYSPENPPQLVTLEPGANWIYITMGQLATVVMLFSREPTAEQKATVIKMLKDFERANVFMLQKPNITPDQLAMPFRTIIQRTGRR